VTLTLPPDLDRPLAGAVDVERSSSSSRRSRRVRTALEAVEDSSLPSGANPTSEVAVDQRVRELPLLLGESDSVALEPRPLMPWSQQALPFGSEAGDLVNSAVDGRPRNAHAESARGLRAAAGLRSSRGSFGIRRSKLNRVYAGFRKDTVNPPAWVRSRPDGGGRDRGQGARRRASRTSWRFPFRRGAPGTPSERRPRARWTAQARLQRLATAASSRPSSDDRRPAHRRWLNARRVVVAGVGRRTRFDADALRHSRLGRAHEVSDVGGTLAWLHGRLSPPSLSTSRLARSSKGTMLADSPALKTQDHSSARIDKIVSYTTAATAWRRARAGSPASASGSTSHETWPTRRERACHPRCSPRERPSSPGRGLLSSARSRTDRRARDGSALGVGRASRRTALDRLRYDRAGDKQDLVSARRQGHHLDAGGISLKPR